MPQQKTASTSAKQADRNAAARARRAKWAEYKRTTAADAQAARDAASAAARTQADRHAQSQLDADAAVVVAAKNCVQEWLNEPRNSSTMGRAHAELIRCVLNRRALGLTPFSYALDARVERS